MAFSWEAAVKMRCKTLGAISVGLSFAFAHVAAANAAEIKVLSAVAMKAAFDDLAREFERTSGHKVTVSYATAGVLRKRIQDGEFGDMTILPRPVFEALVTQAQIDPGSSAVFARSTVGVSVRSGAPKPDISSADAVRRSMLAAKSVVYADPAQGGASGIHFAKVLERLGIVEEMRPKTKLVPVAGAAEVVAKGEAEIAVSQTIDLLRVAGTDYVGPLPPELQNTSDFVFLAGILTGAKQAEAVKALIQFLQSPGAAGVVKAKGLEPGE
jgi:molybdate transport system substrate-binding protein